jgi:hypothetical protein
MRLARHAAARCGLLVWLAIGPQPISVLAADDDILFLPVDEAARIAEPEEQPRTKRVRRSMPLSFGSLPTREQILPKRVEIPDMYKQEFDITLRPYVAPVNGDRVVAFDLLPRPYQPWAATLAYDEERRGPIPGDAGGSGDVVRFILERKF